MRMLRNCLLLAAVCAVSLVLQGWTVAEAMFDLTQTSVRYESDGETYILSYESVPRTGTYTNSAPHGDYLVHSSIEGGTLDFSFDREDDDVYMIYYDGGSRQRISYDEDNESMYVQDYDDDADSGTYEYYSSTGRYTLGSTNHSIPPRVAALITNHYTVGDTFSAYTDSNGTREFEVMNYPEERSASNLPSKWYTITNTSDFDDWIAFTYNKSNGVYTMYEPTYNGFEKYSYRRFVNNYTLQIQQTGSGIESGTYVKESNGVFYHNNDHIYKYVTDGMLIFRNQCVK